MSSKKTKWVAKHNAFRKSATAAHYKRLAKALGVSTESLRRLYLGWKQDDRAWTFPERDGNGRIIGIMCRFRDGTKRVLTGSKRGIYIPHGWEDMPGPIVVPEGVSDVAALLSRGICAIGRPACQGGVEQLAELLNGTDREIVILGENDVKTDGKWPGRAAAEKVATDLARSLNRAIRWTLPPADFKDIRDLITRGGTS